MRCWNVNVPPQTLAWITWMYLPQCDVSFIRFFQDEQHSRNWRIMRFWGGTTRCDVTRTSNSPFGNALGFELGHFEESSLSQSGPFHHSDACCNSNGVQPRKHKSARLPSVGTWRYFCSGRAVWNFATRLAMNVFQWEAFRFNQLDLQSNVLTIFNTIE